MPLRPGKSKGIIAENIKREMHAGKPQKQAVELQAEIGRLQQELIRRVCGDPVAGVGLKLGVEHGK